MDGFDAMAELARPKGWWVMASACVFCDMPAQGNYSIHRDGFGVGPEVELCDDCGSGPSPTCGEIWDEIAVPSSARYAHKPKLPAFNAKMRRAGKAS